MSLIEKKLAELQVTLPEVEPAGNYLPAVRTGNIVFISGQLPKVEGRIAFKGRVGRDLNLESARRAARACVANLLAALKGEIANLDQVKRILRLTGYINTYPGFSEHAKVLDAASELLIDIFGEAGKHSRVAVGVVELPLGAAIEMEMIVEVR